MKSLVIELQEDALNKSISVSDLLRKALVVSKKLGLSDIEEWVENELNGYDEKKEVPPYRELIGHLQYRHPFRGWESLISSDPTFAEKLSHRRTGQKIAELENLMTSEGKSLQMPLPYSLQHKLCANLPFATEIHLFVSQSSIAGIIDAVRTIILKWSLKLEEMGIHGEGLSFTAQEREAAEKNSMSSISFYGPAQHVQILQGNGQAVQMNVSCEINIEATRAFIEKLESTLPKLELAENQLAEISADVQRIRTELSFPKPKSVILGERLLSIKTILEGAAGTAIGTAGGQLLIELGKLILNQ